MWTRRLLKTRAKAVLKLSYWKAFLVSLLLAVVGGNSGIGGSINSRWNFGEQTPDFQGSLSSISDILPYLILFIFIFFTVILLVLAFRILLGYPLEVGSRRYFIQAAQNNIDMNALGFAFEKPKYLNIIKAMFWRGLLNFLWFLLLIIPGIVKSYAYSLVPYILADNPNIDYKRALELSIKMTQGQKFKMFILDLSFIGWFILGSLAFLVGTLFVLPYVNATQAELYLFLRQKALDNGSCSYEELLLNSI